jgi:hypothetical protein
MRRVLGVRRRESYEVGSSASVVSGLDGILLDTRIKSEAHRAVLGEPMLDSTAVGAVDPSGVASWRVRPHPCLGWAASKELLDSDRNSDLLLLAGIEED